MIPFDNPHDKDYAKEENEGYGSRIYGLYDGLQKKTSDVFQVSFFSPFIDTFIYLSFYIRWFIIQPKAVVDTIKSESEIYGNTGDNLKPLSNVVVSTMAVVSDVVNRLVDVSPQNG